jgi:spore coat protein CotH
MTATRRYTIAELIREPMIKRIRNIPILVVLLAGPIAVGLLAGVPRAAVAQAADPADAFFNDNVIHEIRLSVNTKDWQVLTENWLDDTKYPADFRWNGQVVHNVAIHSRGGGSRRPNKVSLRVDFSHYTDGQTFLGLKSFILRNNSQDATNMRERVSMLFFRNLGVSAQREAHTRLYINNVYYGLFTICESPDEHFLQRNLGESTGHLYEYHFDNQAVATGQAVFTLGYLGPTPSLYVPNLFVPKTLENDPQGDVLARLFQTIGDTTSADWRTNVSAFLDLSKFIRHLGIENFLAEEDGLTGDYGPNNFYFYRFANTTTFLFIPWDKSNAFWSADYPILHNIVDGPDDKRNVLAARALQEPDLLKLYLDTMLECATFALQGATPSDPGWLEAEINREYDQIHTAALADTSLYTNDEFEQAVLDMKSFAQLRSSAVQQQVAAAARSR